MGLHWTLCLVCLDDITIFSQTISDHLQKLQEVLARLQKAGLKSTKQVLSDATKSPLPWPCGVSKRSRNKSKESKLCPGMANPTDVKELQQFPGLASYYRQFVKNFAHKARPLYRLT